MSFQIHKRLKFNLGDSILPHHHRGAVVRWTCNRTMNQKVPDSNPCHGCYVLWQEINVHLPWSCNMIWRVLGKRKSINGANLSKENMLILLYKSIITKMLWMCFYFWMVSGAHVPGAEWRVSAHALSGDQTIAVSATAKNSGKKRDLPRHVLHTERRDRGKADLLMHFRTRN